MTEHRPFAVWLRALAGLLALACALGLGGCGGGSGAPNNVFDTPGPLTIQPGSDGGSLVVYSGTPLVLNIFGGQPPYRAFSSNSGILPVVQSVAGSTIVLLPANVSLDSDVTITVQDTPPGRAPETATVIATVRAAPLLNSLTITPTSTDCGTAICTGEDGIATVTVLGPQGAPIAGRAVRFDVVTGQFLIRTNNPATPLVTSLVAVSDQNGIASVIIRASPGVPTQFAQLSATDLTSGQTLTGTFLIQEFIDGSKVLTVVPATANITGAFTGECSSGFRIDYYIYGGTPPYRISSTFPDSINLTTKVVNVEGGFFEAITNGSCVNPLTFSIVDAAGLQTTATLTNVPGTTDRPVIVAPALAVTPTSVTATSCVGKTFTFIASGGTPSYGAVVTPTPPGTAAVASNKVTVSGLIGNGTFTLTVFDQSSPQKTATATITCGGASSAPPMVVSAGFDYSASTCAGQSSAFVITGGTPPYTAAFSTPPTGGGTITPTTIAASGQGFTVTGLQNTPVGQLITNITVSDSSTPQNQVTRTIQCP